MENITTLAMYEDRYFDFVLRDGKYPTTLEERIAFTILEDVTDRRGWRQEFDGFDNDIKDEILETWIKKISFAMTCQPDDKFTRRLP